MSHQPFNDQQDSYDAVDDPKLFVRHVIHSYPKKAAQQCAATLDVVAWLLDAQLLTNVDHVGILNVVQLAYGLHTGVVLFSKRT